MNLIVATDFSTHGKAVLKAACKLALRLDAKVWVIHALAPSDGFRSYGAGPRTDRPASVADDTREENRLVQEAAASLRAEGLEAVGMLVEGPPAQTLLDEAARLEADMIVVGSHGYGAVFEVLLGSVSAGVIRRATCPVLVIPIARNDD